MCNFSLDGPWPLGDPSCCRRVGTACPPHSVFPPPALMSPFHYCVAIYHTHGQGDFVGTCVCVCGGGPGQTQLVTRYQTWHGCPRTLGNTCPGYLSHVAPDRLGKALAYVLSALPDLSISQPTSCLCPSRLAAGHLLGPCLCSNTRLNRLYVSGPISFSHTGP